ncbi:helix-turn-helix domain-containing protein [uncultured Tateyamaria sp.]|uniref:helix-turn-helix domain-containing protein n=1 Tax=uncultured Tateyamaria sp. TaxID=455651 RepID=UPI0026123CDA|nr:helix-turn-helix domain-containing protein [uncultured Tateyamaria sp.]
MSLPYYRIKPTEHSFIAAIEQWRASRRDMYDIAALNGDIGRSFFQTTAFRSDNIVFSKTRSRNLFLSRHRRQLDSDVSGFVRIKFTTGNQLLNSNSGEFENSARRALTVVDYSRPIDMFIRDVQELGVYLPHSAIDFQPGQMNAQTNFCLDSAAGRILSSTMATTYSQLHQATIEDASSIASGFAGLVRGLLEGGAMSQNESKMQQARARSMRDFLERNLRDPDLSAATLQKAFGASRATIFRDFSGYGGIARYILNRRLERALSDLAEAAPKRGEVTRTAEHWGFLCASQFSRAFRSRFGFAPGTAIGTLFNPPYAGQTSIGGDKSQRALGIQGDPGRLEKWLSQYGSR